MHSPIAPPTTPVSERRDRIRALLQEVSLETAAREAAVAEACRAPLPRGGDVYITALPGDSPAATLRAARLLAAAGFNPVPHLGARYIASLAALEALLAGLVAEAGVTRFLVIGGDADRPAGPFRSSLDLLASGALERHGIRSVGLAAYPEGHPRIAPAVLAEALAAKIARLRESGIAPYVVTQFCFEAAPICRWLKGFAAEAGIPVRIGLAGPAKLSTLLRYALRCGVGPSLRALSRGGFRARLLTEAGPEPVIAGLAECDASALGIAGLHLFTFGGMARTAAWLAAIARGDFEIPLDGLGFDVRT